VSTSSPAPQFGPNEWLVEEMYEQFLADPSSVDPAWHDFFADYKPTQRAMSQSAATTKARDAVAAAATKVAPPTTTPKPPPAPVDTPNGQAPAVSAPPKPAPAAAGPVAPVKIVEGDQVKPMRGAGAVIAKNMDLSLTIPTATSVRSVPAKLLADNRIVINNHLRRTRGGKVSFTHVIGYAVIRALDAYPNMNRHYAVVDGKPTLVTPEHVNLGLAIDLPGKDGSRNLVVASIKGCEGMSFTQFWQAYEDIIRKARNNALTTDDFTGTTISLTNPGTIGTNHSVPRFTPGQGAIVGVGAMDYPAQYQGTSERTLTDLAVSKIITLTSTYDHRIIQGAESGEFLRRIHQLMLGEDGFYDNIFTSLRIPYEPVRWVEDIPEGAIDKTTRVIGLVDAYRTRGHLMADTDPLNYRQRKHEDLDILSHGLTLWDLDREFPVGGFAGKDRLKLRDVLGVLRDSYCRTVGIEYTHILDPAERRWIQQRVEVRHEKPPQAVQKYILSKLNAAEAFETFLQTKYVGQKRFSLEGGESVIPLLDTLLDKGGAGFTVLPVALHGDAAFAGQGVVAETLNLALLRGYRTGGTVHVIINNQVGFTTAPEASRSSQYATDVAKMIQAPVFHVNGDDPEACYWVAALAMDYRQTFNKDVVIDMVCYRRRGHNEGDDPSMTQPAMYDIIDTKRSVRKTYTEALIGRGDISVDEAEKALRDFSSQLEHVFNEVRELEKHPAAPSPSVESEQQIPAKVATAVSREVIERIADAHINLPEGFAPHPRVKPVLERRAKMAREGGIDWAFAELLAFGSLNIEGRMVRLSGQDSRRGTFTQRHAVIIDRNSGKEYTPLQNLSADQGRFLAYDSALSEYAALGFEYGYSFANPDALVLWEAQFGDFVNGAQSVIDEYISSSEAKWGQCSDVAVLLPHGHEGQGPDHTSGRIERWLQLCAEGSMTVALPSTPANYFHLLRRHSLDGVQRPLIVFTPKSMLRNKAAVSSVEEFIGDSRFNSIIDDPTVTDPDAIRKVLFVSGKLYYELAAEKEKLGALDTAIVRIEQLYPVATKRLQAIFDRYRGAADYRWVQEEPANQGAWPFYGLHLPELFPELPRLSRVSRRMMSAPSAGSSKVHEIEQRQIIEKAFT
jgi:2-oxoglutarate dehydrogenase complex dehydrogenase (E1) component-like enzyme